MNPQNERSLFKYIKIYADDENFNSSLIFFFTIIKLVFYLIYQHLLSWWIRGLGVWVLGGGVGDWVGVSDGGGGGELWKITKKGTKNTTQPRKNWSFAKKHVVFFTQKDLPASQKTEILHEKWQRNEKKSTKKSTQPRKNWSFAWKKFFFYSKRPPSLAKNWIFAWKNDKKLTKKWPKKADTSSKMLKFCMKNLKSSYLWGFWKKKSRPPTSPNF